MAWIFGGGPDPWEHPLSLFDSQYQILCFFAFLLCFFCLDSFFLLFYYLNTTGLQYYNKPLLTILFCLQRSIQKLCQALFHWDTQRVTKAYYVIHSSYWSECRTLPLPYYHVLISGWIYHMNTWKGWYGLPFQL